MYNATTTDLLVVSVSIEIMCNGAGLILAASMICLCNDSNSASKEDFSSLCMSRNLCISACNWKYESYPTMCTLNNSLDMFDRKANKEHVVAEVRRGFYFSKSKLVWKSEN